MGKDSNGKELGAGIYQRKDGRYEARIRIKGQKKPYSIYDTNLRKLKQKKETVSLIDGKQRFKPLVYANSFTMV